MRRKALGATLTVALVCVTLSGCGSSATSSGSGRAIALVSDPAGLVDPIDGTGTGPVSPRSGRRVSWRRPSVRDDPVESGHHAQPCRSGWGYSYADSRIAGFSLTHLSGTGCASYGDVPILPTTGPIGATPERGDGCVLAFHRTQRTGTVQCDPRLAGENRAGCYHQDGHLPVHLRTHPSGQPALQGGRKRQSGHRHRCSHGGPERDRRSGHQWPVLWNRDQLHALLRRHVQPALRRGRQLERFDGLTRDHDVPGTACGAYVTFDTSSNQASS